jgi:hypothetical protein
MLFGWAAEFGDEKVHIMTIMFWFELAPIFSVKRLF